MLQFFVRMFAFHFYQKTCVKLCQIGATKLLGSLSFSALQTVLLFLLSFDKRMSPTVSLVLKKSWQNQRKSKLSPQSTPQPAVLSEKVL